jgi:mono/diheme cytochrome c family protein
MKLLVAVTVVAWLTVSMLAAQTAKTAKSRTAAARVARGKYLVEDIGLCGDCHTPRDQKGEPMKGQWLKGAAIDFKPIAPVPVWADKAPAIAGLPGWEDGAAIKFLMTGIAYNGLPRRPPMPRFRFNVQDAQAIVAYLKSLAPGR